MTDAQTGVPLYRPAGLAYKRSDRQGEDNLMSLNELSPLHQTVMTTRTDFWNDSCSVEELTYAISNGAVGATSNPTIVVNVLKKGVACLARAHSGDHCRKSGLVGSGSRLDIG